MAAVAKRATSWPFTWWRSIPTWIAGSSGAKKGYLFITGDELPYPAVSRHQIGSLVGDTLDADVPIAEAIAAAAETYHVFFLIPDLGRRGRCEKRWRDLLGDHVICMEEPGDACAVAAAIVGLTEHAIADIDALVTALDANAIAPQRVSAIVRALRPYADLLDPNAATRMHIPAAGTPGGPVGVVEAHVRVRMAMSSTRLVSLLGLGFGDCGKGLFTDYLCRHWGAHTVVRFNGGAQAGHNVVLPDGRHHTFAQFGAGSFVPGVVTLLAYPVIVHPTALLVEDAYLRRAGGG